MNKNSDINELEIYREALAFSNLIWGISLKWGFFEKKTIGVQLVRAADSISANIAEGFGRYHYRENINFCYYARGSFYEVCDWLRKAITRKLIPNEKEPQIKEFIDLFPRQLNSYIQYLKKCANSPPIKPINQ
ncbi:MAG: four helix bundle protein [Chloroflexi bacterium]|nr:four helix bundle protein [Chloroflexota bacterium]